ncbi:MAG: hypothetical protein ACI9CF_000980 [Candidatus Omnitrophota bacterium]|jgi:hypothetical protein
MSNSSTTSATSDKINMRQAIQISFCKQHRDTFKLIRFKSEKRQNYSCCVKDCGVEGFAYPEPKDLPKELKKLQLQ